MKYKVDDKVRVTSKEGGHGFEVNDVVKVGHAGFYGPPYKCYNNSGEWWWLNDNNIEPLINTIEVNGKKYEECTYSEWMDSDQALRIDIDSETAILYKAVKEEFKTNMTGVSVVEIETNGEKMLYISDGFRVRPDDIERVLKEYKEYLKR